MNKVSDIVELISRTGLCAKVCKEAYEANGCNVEKTEAFLMETHGEDAITSALTDTGNKSKKMSIAACVLSAIILFSMSVVSVVFAFIDTSRIWLYIVIALVSVFFGLAMLVAKDNQKSKTPEQINTESRNTRILSKEYAPAEISVCPICGKLEVEIKWKKFSKAKAMLGLAATNRCYGALFGVPNNTRVKAVCHHCGSKFRVINK